jgi:release factor glutamine methyltransferase
MSPEKEEPMMILRLPGVYPPQHDTSLLADALLFERLTARSRVLDLCTGTGALAVAASAAGAGHVVAVDISRRACANARLNGILNGTSIDSRRGDLTEAVHGELFDLVISNPPYVPALADDLPTAGIERAWDAGKDGRALIDRIAAATPAPEIAKRSRARAKLAMNARHSITSMPVAYSSVPGQPST